MARILIAEDDGLQAEALKLILEEHKHEVTAVSNGVQCLLQLDKGADFDIVLTDVFMPQMDGIELIRELRARKSTVPVIAMTGGVSGGLHSFARSMEVLGAFAVLAKPFSASELTSSIARVLESR